MFRRGLPFSKIARSPHDNEGKSWKERESLGTKRGRRIGGSLILWERSDNNGALQEKLGRFLSRGTESELYLIKLQCHSQFFESFTVNTLIYREPARLILFSTFRFFMIYITPMTTLPLGNSVLRLSTYFANVHFRKLQCNRRRDGCMLNSPS